MLLISSKTVERHERRATPVRRYQLESYAGLYGCEVASLEDMLEEAA